MPERPRYALVTLLAYNELLRLKVGACPIRSGEFLTPCGQSVIVCSYQEFSKLTCVPLEKISLYGRLEDGFSVFDVSECRTMIFYNAERYTQRVRFTLIHEVGHIICHHKRNAPVEEAEANLFASQFLMPSAVILEIIRRGHCLDAHKLCRVFDVSTAAANIKLSQLQRNPHTLTHLDSAIISRFTPYLDQYFPPKLSPFSHACHFYGSIENYRAFQKLEDDTLFP